MPFVAAAVLNVLLFQIVLPPHLERIREKLAENSHELWAVTRIEQGWTFGAVCYLLIELILSQLHIAFTWQIKEISVFERNYFDFLFFSRVILLTPFGFSCKFVLPVSPHSASIGNHRIHSFFES